MGAVGLLEILTWIIFRVNFISGAQRNQGLNLPHEIRPTPVISQKVLRF